MTHSPVMTPKTSVKTEPGSEPEMSDAEQKLEALFKVTTSELRNKLARDLLGKIKSTFDREGRVFPERKRWLGDIGT